MDWPRFWWTLAMVGVCLVFAGLLWLGWRNRRRRQAEFPALPTVPSNRPVELTPAVSGLYVSTVYAEQWQNRIVAASVGRRAQSTLHLTAGGIEIARTGEPSIWIPKTAMTKVGTAPGTAGKVMGTPDGILLITWKWGETLVASGIRGDDLFAQVPWIDAANKLITDGESLNGVTK